MSSNMSDRSDQENQTNLERFTPLMYQLKKQSGASGQNHSMQSEIVGQEPGCYPYPSGDRRKTPKEKIVEEKIAIVLKDGKCFKPTSLL